MPKPVAVLLSFLLTLLLAEGLIRVVSPTPRVQVIDPASGRLTLRVQDGVPLWTVSDDDLDRLRADCAPGPEGLDVLVIGDSILHNHAVDRSGEVVEIGALMQEALETTHPGSCVRNHAMTGYTGIQQRIALEEALARLDPDVVVYEMWKHDGQWVRMGPVWANTENFETTEAGLPRLGVGLLDALGPWLVPVSALWRYTLLTLGEPEDGRTDRQLYGAMFDSLDRLADNGIPAVLALPCPLDRPFAESIDPDMRDWRVVHRAGEETGTPVVSFARVLVDEEVTALRRDTCCHYNAAGLRALAPVLADAVRRRVSEPDPSP